MSEKREQEGKGLGFLDSVTRLFRERKGAAAPAAAAPSPPDVAAKLDAAIRDLDRKIEERRRAAEARGGVGAAGVTAEERAEVAQQRMEAAHKAIRADIEAMHAKLGTGLGAAELEGIAAQLRELAGLAAQAKDSHEILARGRFAIGERLLREAGALAVTQLVALLQKQHMSWPDPTRYRPDATPEEIERSRTRRLRDVREAFIGQDFARAADCVLGVVRNWRSDYPEPGTPLWEETVLEAVGGALRGRLLGAFVEVLRRDRDAVLGQTEAAIGKEVEALHAVVAAGVDSIAQANQAVASSLRAVDQVFADIAWEHVRSTLPEAQG